MHSKHAFSRASYIRPESTKIASKKSPAVAYLSKTPIGRLAAIGFYGKADKPAFNYTFKTTERRAEYVGQWLRDMDARAARKVAQQAERRAKMAAPNPLAVGDVLSCSWGYDQTNIDYYQVVAIVGKRSVSIRKIGRESVETLSMQGECVPAVGEFISEPMTKLVNEWGGVRIASYATATKLEKLIVAGKPVGYRSSHWTAYA